MQQKSPTDKGRQIATMFFFFGMSPLMINPSKYSLAIILPSIAMLYFNFKKYREEKQAGAEYSKFGLICIMQLICTIVLTITSVVNYLISIGYYD